MKKRFIICVLIFCLSISLAGCGKSNADNQQNVAPEPDRIEEIRNTKNTDVSERTGKIFYLSADGDDAYDGLSEQSAWKTLKKMNDRLGAKIIVPGDTVLLRRGDVFLGTVNATVDGVMFGCYGNEKLAKPQICVSPQDGAKVGEWTEIETQIWQYTVDGRNAFEEDVGVIWCFDEGGAVTFTQKITTPEGFDDSDCDLNQILKNDLEFYVTGHPYAFNNRAEGIFLRSPVNPAERFARIEFAVAKSGVAMWNRTDIIVDNLDVRFAGIHGLSAGTVANLTVSNCEFSYIGGAVQKYEQSKAVRYGNGVEVYGSVTQKNGYEVKEGYVVKNNYVHDIYDAGITFQLSTDEASPVERVIFDGNVIERCVYSIEYWNNCWSKDEELQKQTYINTFEITNNVMRYAGYGVCGTRPDKNQSAHIKTWKHNVDNLVTGKYVIENNVFHTALEHVFYVYAVNADSLPVLKNNEFFNFADVPFGYMYSDEKQLIAYDVKKLDALFPGNKFNVIRPQ